MAESMLEQEGPALTYASLDDAALAFARIYYPLTLATGHEWYANLYRIPEQEPPAYYFDDVSEGDACSVALLLPAYWVEPCRIYAGNIHTHPAGHRIYNRFSIHDITAYKYLLSHKSDGCTLEGYLVTQERKVYRYNGKSEADWRVPWELEVGEF